ncbi:MAG: hypothetical protein Rubg2KO_11620 [Rubricoccaceae bacterium]
MTRIPFAVLIGALAFTACDTTGTDLDPVALNVQTATSIAADPTSGRDPNTGQPLSNNLYTLYDLDAGEIVLASSETDATVRQRDSSSTVWDIGFKGSTIIINGGTSGPGQGAAQIVNEAFAAVTEAPAIGYTADGANTTCPEVVTPGGTVPGSSLAICTGSDNGWYSYSPQQNLLSPIAGRTIVLMTGDGNYAKVRILNYYEGNPATPDPNQDASRYFTFEYVIQPDGSRDFQETTPES